MQLYNTLTRVKSEFQPQNDPITMYVCGVTPYDDAHLGHAMSIVIFDVLRRFLEWSGKSVRFVYNFTDVDDKMIARAERLGIPVAQLAEQQIDRFQAEWRELNIRPADVHPRATHPPGSTITLDTGLVSRAMNFVEGQQNGDGSWDTTQHTKNQVIPWDSLRTPTPPTRVALRAGSLVRHGTAGPSAAALSAFVHLPFVWHTGQALGQQWTMSEQQEALTPRQQPHEP